MTHGSLFSGIGGFDLAAEWMGWENVFHCEWNEFGQKVLKYYWPKAISYEDITKTDFTVHRGRINILTGGFPCQPYSLAGQRKGKEDDRHLWPEMLRAIREIKPQFVVGENVSGIISWNEGLVFEEVCAELEAEGYEVQPVLLPACGVNAPHRRDRVWFVANSHDTNRHQSKKYSTEARQQTFDGSGRFLQNGNASNSNHKGLERNWEERTSQEWQDTERSIGSSVRAWEQWPSQSPICSGNDGISNRLDGITFSKWRKESIKAYGNAIVPQVAYQIFKALEKSIL